MLVRRALELPRGWGKGGSVCKPGLTAGVWLVNGSGNARTPEHQMPGRNTETQEARGVQLPQGPARVRVGLGGFCEW